MSLPAFVRAQLAADAKGIGRDPLLGWVLALPLPLAVFFRLAVPAAEEWLRHSPGLDLAPYRPLLASFYLMTVPGLVGMVVGFLLLDERDENTFTALLVTPLPTRHYLLYRLGMPLALGLAVTLAGYPLLGFAPLGPAPLLAAAGLGAFAAPVIALALAGFAANKVAGFALVKVVNAVNLMPVVAWFVAMPWQAVAGVVPTYWPMKVVWAAAAGEAWGAAAAVGLAVNATATVLLLRRFERVLRR